MRKGDRLQKFLYLIMAVLAVYIIGKTGSILLKSDSAGKALENGSVQRPLEDAAMRTYAPGYTSVVEEKEEVNWIAQWMKPVVPVYSYLAEGEAKGQTGEVQESEGLTEENGQAGEKLPEETQQEEIPVTELKEELQMEESQATELPEEIQMEANSVTEPQEEIQMEANPVTELQKEIQMQETQVTEQMESDMENQDGQVSETDNLSVPAAIISPALQEQLSDLSYLISNYYIVDAGTSVDESLFQANELLSKDFTITKNPEVPQILIYHTHSQEAFADSREGQTEDTIVGMGELLADILREEYGYNVIHDTGVYDLVDGVLDRSTAYDYARESVEQILAEHPTIEVIIDLHRDGVDGTKFVTDIGGKPTSMIMFFNGLSRNEQEESLSWLPNPYLQENLAFSLQLELLAREQYPGFTRNIYLKAERFNLHLRPRSLLVEAGTQLNTVEEERNAMTPLADLLNQVLEGR